MTGKPFIILPTVDSTNNHAMQLIREGKAADGLAIFSMEQTEGKGQRGRNWHSEAGKNIMLTTIMDGRSFSITQQFPVSAAVSVACYDFFSKYAGDETSIKWPNDLYWRDRKAGGILIENVIRKDQWQWIVAGTGINVNQVDFNAIHSKPVSLKQITGKNFDPIELSHELTHLLMQKIEQLKTNGAETILANYNQLLFKKGQEVQLRKNQVVFKAFIQQVNISGELEINRGFSELIKHGEVEWIL